MDEPRETKTPHGLSGWQYGTGPIFVGQRGEQLAWEYRTAKKRLAHLEQVAAVNLTTELENASIER